jgi:subtilisin-like proprotein convertase family protein
MNQEERPGSSACGWNDQGVLLQICLNGEWIDTEECLEESLSCNAERYLFSETVCGVNTDQNEGQLVFECTSDDVWNTEGICVNQSSSAPINDAPELTTPLGQLVERSPYCEIESLTIDINIEHTWVGDLVLTLISPNGERITLQQAQFGGLNNLEGNYPSTLTIQDQETFNNLIGSKANGLWLLDVVDLQSRDTGRIVEWGLNIECSTQCEGNEQGVSDEVCYNDGNETAGFLSMMCNNEEFSYTDICLYPHDSEVAINDLSTVISAYTFESDQESCIIDSVSVNLDLVHTYIGDLQITLKSPTYHSVVLHQRNLRNRNRLQGSYPESLTVFDQMAFNRLLGMEANGLWTLTVSDFADQDVGILNSWSVDVECR